MKILNLLKRRTRKYTIEDLIAAITVASSRAETRKLITEYKELIRCMDCHGFYHHACMTFDHREREYKKKNVSGLITTSKAAVIEELQKCDLVCHNCHDIREYVRDRQPASAALIKRRLFNGMKLG